MYLWRPEASDTLEAPPHVSHRIQYQCKSFKTLTNALLFWMVMWIMECHKMCGIECHCLCSLIQGRASTIYWALVPVIGEICQKTYSYWCPMAPVILYDTILQSILKFKMKTECWFLVHAISGKKWNIHNCVLYESLRPSKNLCQNMHQS
jgi:hypothetical protein